MIVLQAPHSLIQTTTILPDPEWNDGEGIMSTMSLNSAEDGTLYSYVKRTDRRKLGYTFQLSRAKALELKEFIIAYAGEKIRLTNHKDEVWVVVFADDNFDFAQVDRCNNMTITLQFEGVKIA